MPEQEPTNKKNLSPDWFVQGILTKIGDTFDRFTGRGWKPSSSLATSELIERMKSLLDAEARLHEDHRTYVPHNIKLKMQWDKFSTDSEASLRKLENEFLIAAVDHINDRHYYTFAPLSIEVKPDYFTSGVKLFVSFDKFTDEEHEAELDVTVPGAEHYDDEEITQLPQRPGIEAVASFELNAKTYRKSLILDPGKRLSIGRTRENDLAIDDISVSKFHASLMLGENGGLVIADTGSTNGTFVNGQRIAYGKAVSIGRDDKLRLGSIDVLLEWSATETESNARSVAGPTVKAELPQTEPALAIDADTISETDKA
ncbi:MAG: FHA domain-containing protein [Pyrinomonadaceae bacterium]|nr:FHA domain-containing protein [Pyrinomonadaceae bacterium]